MGVKKSNKRQGASIECSLFYGAVQAVQAQVSALQALADNQAKSIAHVEATRAATADELANVIKQLMITVRAMHLALCHACRGAPPAFIVRRSIGHHACFLGEKSLGIYLPCSVMT